VFITFEGPEASGKTTQVRLLAERLRQVGHEVVATHEPGGTRLGEQVRSILLDRDGPSLTPLAEAMLFAASRAQLVGEVIDPALARGAVVVVDRFADSTRAYQGGGEGLSPSIVEALIAHATGGLLPDLTVLLDIPAGKAMSGRLAGRNEDRTRFEVRPESFHEQVRHAYLVLAKAEPGRWLVVNGMEPITPIADRIWAEVERRLGSSALR
jgi:dTMP kinase